MDKRKAIVIAVVLFLLIGLGTFVFANPSEERLDGNDTGITDNGNNNEVDGENTDGEEETEQPAEETEDDDVISVIDDGNDNTGNGNSGNGNSGSSNNNNNNGNGNNNENNNNNNNNNNNGGSTEEDNSAYLAALAALEKAEASYLQGDLDAANDLISDLADGSDKQGLVDRANALQNVINVETLVKNLQNQVNAAENMDNVNSARDYRANEDIINKVNNLADSSKKEELKGILSEVAVILDDTTAPGISGIDNGVVTALDVALTVDETNVTVLVNGEEKTLDEIKNITEHGTYKVTVTDQAYNATTIEFTIDKKLPEFNVESGTHSENAMEIVVTDDTFDYMNVTNQDTGVTEKYTTSIITLEDEATYHIYAFDKAGNYQELWVAIDKNPPTINVAGTNVDGYFRDEEVTLTVFDKFLTEVTVNGETFDKDDFTYANNNENATLTKTYTAEGKYEVVAKDKFGHVTTYTFVIDQTAPIFDLSQIADTFEVGVDTYVYPQPGIVTDNIDGNISFGEVHMQWFKKNADGSKGEATTCFGGNNWNTGLTNCDLGTYIVTYKVSDKAGNQTYIEKEITVQDKTPATFIPSYYTKNVELDVNGKFTDYPTIEVKDNAPGQVTYKLISDNVDVTKIGDYALVYQTTDANGNQKKHTIPVRVRDNAAPNIGDLESDKTYYESIPYNMSDNSGSFDLYYAFNTEYNSCDELMAGASNSKIHVDGSYSGTYDIPMDADNVSVCLVDASQNKTFRNKITIRQNESNEDTIAPNIGELESGMTYTGSISYNMSDNSGSFDLYYAFNTEYNSCDELMAGASNSKIHVDGSYSGTYDIPMDADNVSVCLVDASQNKTFRNKITIRMNKEVTDEMLMSFVSYPIFDNNDMVKTYFPVAI